MVEQDELIKLIRVLNKTVSMEYSAAIQYNQHGMLLTGSGELLS